jgi:type 1 glutamine amidotransferase
MSHGNPYGKDSFPPHEIERRMKLALTYGASPSIAVAQPDRLQQELYRCMDAVQQCRPWITHKQPEHWAAILMSDNTRTFYGREPGTVEERYMSHVMGVFRACVEEHLPANLINDWNLNRTDLAKYSVLILPNAACLDSQQTQAISEFVHNGGGLVASLDSSLFDEFGNPRDNFALAEIFGVDYGGIPAISATPENREIDVNFAKSIGPDYWDKRKNVFDFRQDTHSFLNEGKMKIYVGADAVTFKGPAVHVVSTSGTTCVGTMRAKAADAPEIPCVLTHQHGLGKVVYLAAGFDSAYYMYPYPYHRLILNSAVRWTASSQPPVEVRAPMCVHSTIMRQQTDHANRLVVHLFNDVNTTGGHALPVDDVPLREEVLPISDIELTFRPEYHIKNVRLQPEGIELDVNETPNGRRVSVPKLRVHFMVVVELE